MKALILSAGLGTRLMPITKKTPKPMVKVANIPIIDYTLEFFRRNGVKYIFINRHKFYKKFNAINKKNLNIYFSIEKEILGTAGGIYSFRKHLKKDFIVCNGDIIFNLDLKDLIRKHKESKNLVTLVLKKKKKENVTGLLLNKDKTLVEKIGEGEYFFTGIYILNEKVFPFLENLNSPSCFVSDFLIPFLKNENKVSSYVMKEEDFWFETGTIEDYIKTNMLFLDYYYKDNNFYYLDFIKNRNFN